MVKAFVGEGAELQRLPNTVVRGSLMIPQRVGFLSKMSLLLATAAPHLGAVWRK